MWPVALPLTHETQNCRDWTKLWVWGSNEQGCVPCLNGSVLHFQDYLHVSKVSMAVTWMSSKHKFISRSNWGSEGATTFPDLKNPKKHRHEATHSSLWSAFPGSAAQKCFNSSGILGVIGKHLQLPGIEHLFIPQITYYSHSIWEIIGSPSPKLICSYFSAARYVFIVVGASLLEIMRLQWAFMCLWLLGMAPCGWSCRRICTPCS